MVTDEFRKIAVSFAGGDGGNPKSEVWFCGLEWGIGDESSPDDFYEKFSLSPKLIPHSWVEDDFDGSWTTQYNRKICWFLWYYYNLDWKMEKVRSILLKNTMCFTHKVLVSN